MQFNNIRLLVKDFDKCFAFYKETLGLECTWGALGENYASFNIGIPSGLALFSAELMNSAIGNENQAPAEKLNDKTTIVLQVDDISETYADLQERGVDFMAAPRDMPAWGITVAHFRDPEDNLIEIFQNIESK